MVKTVWYCFCVNESPDNVSPGGGKFERKQDGNPALRRRIFEVIADHAAKELARRKKKK